MQSIVTSSVIAGGDAALFAGAGSILASLASLASELYGSKEMCEDLIQSVRGLQPQLKKMITEGKVSIVTNAIQEYETLLRDIQTFLQDHINSGKAARLTKHWKMKDRIKRFYVERDRIQALLNLEFIDEMANNHAQLSDMVTQVAERNARIEEQHKQGLEMLEKQINAIPTSTRQELETAQLTVVALADLKNEIKTNASAYSDADIALMKRVFLAGCDAAHIPRENLSLPIWYISRSVRFDKEDPFASGTSHSLHYGKLDSGARVAVNIVNADANDEASRDRFVKEVNTLFMLRDPHVLPLYGANHFGSPLMYVTAHAQNGNFLTYLQAHRERFWQLFLDAARGLAYLHKNKLVHGNLKCSNLLVMADGTGVVSDFMFAFVRASSVLSLKTKPATNDWTAPECLGVGTDANPRFESDVFALGMCMLEAATGKRPFEGRTSSDESTREMIRNGDLPLLSTLESRDQVDREVSSLVLKMCALDYRERIRLHDVVAILEVLAAQEQVVRESLPCLCETSLCSRCSRRPAGRSASQHSSWLRDRSYAMSPNALTWMLICVVAFIACLVANQQ